MSRRTLGSIKKPVAGSVAVERSSLGLGTGDSPTFTGLTLSDNYTNSGQPAFLARPTSAQNNVATGSFITVVWGTEIFDQGADFASNSFTAPVTGRYQYNFFLDISAIDTAATSYEYALITSNRNFIGRVNPDSYAVDARITFNISILADMDANDTANIRLQQIGGTAQSDILTSSSFSGHLVA